MKVRACDICGKPVTSPRIGKGVRYDYCDECLAKRDAFLNEMVEVFKMPNADRAFAYLLRSTADQFSPKRKKTAELKLNAAQGTGTEATA